MERYRLKLLTFSALLALGSLTFIGCASTGASAPVLLTRAGEAVKVTGDPDMVRGCEYVDVVPSASAWNNGPGGAINAEENPVRELRNSAAGIGANFVLMLTEPSTSAQRAEGYLCAD